VVRSARSGVTLAGTAVDFKDRSWSREGKPGPWDVIVIGSGMGGMIAAALLAKCGRRVLVLEQHYVPGGFTHTFARKGYTWDVGVHAIGEVTTRSMPGRLLASLTDGRLEWASLGPVYDSFHLPDGFHIDYPDNPLQFKENLLEAFPNETRGIEEYLRIAKEVGQGMRAYYLSRVLPPSIGSVSQQVLGRKVQHYLGTTAQSVTDTLTREPKLRAMMTAQWGYYGAKPSRAAFAMQALVVKHFAWGGYYPVGGSGQIARQLLRTVADAGGWSRVRADVKEILVEGGAAVGVRMADGETIRAKKVVSAVGALSTISRLLPSTEKSELWAREISQIGSGPAHVCLYMGFKGDIRKAGAGPNNQWFYDTWDTAEDKWDVSTETLGKDIPALYVSFPSLKDPTHEPGPELRHTGEAVTFVPWSVFEPWRDKRWMRRGDEYEQFKERMQQALLDKLFKRMPGLKPLLDFVELSTPLSTDHFTRASAGSIYGLESTPERFRCKWLRPKSPLQNLYFAGVDSGAPGVIGAAMGGALAAVAAEPVAALNYLRRGVL
jgi:all-trans-retinol 13,14-reductase